MFRRWIDRSVNKQEHQWQMGILRAANKARNASQLREIAQTQHYYRDVRDLAWKLYNAIQEEDGLIVTESMDEETTYTWDSEE
jgi:hypothetical protein